MAEEKEKEKKPEMIQEIAGAGTDIFRGWIGPIMQNPDYVLSKESLGKSYQLYDEMEDKDLHLFGALQQRKLGVVSKPREILPASTDSPDLEIAEFVQGVFGGIEYFDRDVTELLDAVGKGLAISEVIWEIGSDGLIGITEIKNRDPRRFAWGTDGALRLKTPAARLYGEPVPERKFIAHIYSPKYENQYGEPILKKCWWYFWFKKNMIRWWACFGEKFGTPTTVGKYPPGADAAAQDKLLDVIKTLQQETGIIIPENMKLELLEAQRKTSTDTYQGFADYCDSQISQAVLGQTLTSSEGARGTQALGTIHQGVRQDYIEADVRSLQPVLNQLIRWLVDFSFPRKERPRGQRQYPEFVIHAEEPGDLVSLAQRDAVLFRDLAVPVGLNYFYDTYGIPRPLEDEELLELPQSVSRLFGVQGPKSKV